MPALDFLDELAHYLDGQDLGTATVDIFVNKLPDTPVNCLALFNLPGGAIGQGRDVPGLQFPRFQVVIRDEDYNLAADKHQAARAALHGKIGLILPVGVNRATTPYIRILRLHADSEGGPLGEDAQGRPEFAANYSAEYHHYDPA